MTTQTVMQRALARRVATVARLPPRAEAPPSRLRPEILDLVHAALRGGETHYTSRPGVPALRSFIALELFKQGFPVEEADAEEVITSGIEEALTVVGLAHRGAHVVVEPDADRVAAVLIALGLEVSSPADARPSPPAFVYTTAGRGSWPADQLVVHDVGAALWSPGAPRFTAADAQTVVLGSLDGIEGLASFRVGFAAGPAPVVARLRLWKQALSICTAAPSQRAAILSLDRVLPLKGAP